MRLLVVEDDPTIAEPLLAGLRHHGFDVTHVTTGLAAVEAVAAHQLDVSPLDLVLLDLGLPDIDGLDACKQIRRLSNIPVIMVTARDHEVDRVVGLELGADDYIVKPFGIRELIARVRAVHRRFESPPSTTTSVGEVAQPDTATGIAASAQTIGPLRFDHRTHRVFLDDQEINLTPKEYGVLQVLALDPGAVVSRMSLIEQVWDEHWYGPTKTLDVHIAQLRQKLGDARWIETVRSVGYRLVNPRETVDTPKTVDTRAT